MHDYQVRGIVSQPLRNDPHHQILRIARLATARLLRAGWDGSQYQAVIRTSAPFDVVLHMITGAELGRSTMRWAKKSYYIPSFRGN